jgi:hypothetical protein
VFLKLGAPGDEYNLEAAQINAALAALPLDGLNRQSVAAVMALVWAKFFNLSATDIEKRLPAFERVADLLLTHP